MTAGRVDWLPGVLTAAGLDVYVMPGALTRGSSTLHTVRGIVWHHTGTGPNWSDGHVAYLLRDGRRDLAGPLSQLGLERDGTFVVVATGLANHNGYGLWGNQSIGIEAYNSGRGEPWAPTQLDAYVAGTAAILAHLGLDATAMKGHRETDPRRKIDPTGLDLAAERLAITAALHSPTESEPPTMFVIAAPSGRYYLLHAGRLVYISSPSFLDALTTTAGVPTLHPDDGTWQAMSTAYGPV